MLSTIPFAGFYYSVHDALMDDAMDQMFADESGVPNSDLSVHLYHKCRWDEVRMAYVKDYTESFAAELKLDIQFESLSSPREYNFTTDRIFVHISEEEVKRILALTDRKILEEIIRKSFTSRDGFISSYPNDLEEWPDVSEWDHNHIGTLIAAYAETTGWNEDEHELMSHACENGYLERWIEEASPGIIDRLYRIREYLNKRKERQS